MEGLLMLATLVAGYWAGEWPRKLFARSIEFERAKDLLRPADRRAAHFFLPAAFGMTCFMALASVVATSWFVPILLDRYFGIWVVAIMLGSSNVAVGVFEMGTGLLTGLPAFSAYSDARMFSARPEIPRRVGFWRVVSSVSLCLLLLVGLLLL